MLPLHKLAFIPNINFMPGMLLLQAWCSALCLIPREANGLRLYIAKWGSLCSWELQFDTHSGQGGQFSTICFLTLLASIFMGTQNGKEMKNLRGSLLSPFPSLQWKHSLVALLVTICASFEFRYFTTLSWISVSVFKGNWLFQCKLC